MSDTQYEFFCKLPPSLLIKDQRQRTKREGASPAAYRKNSQLEPWYKASRYVSEKLRFIKQYISITPGPTGNSLLYLGLFPKQILSLVHKVLRDLLDPLEQRDPLVNF
jgi:hypothetical protein